MNDIISRVSAKKLGLTYYFTGKPCPHGHVCRRFVSTYGCEVCTDEHKKRYRKDPKVHARELDYKAQYREKNRERVNNYAKIYWRENPSAREVNRLSKSRNSQKISKYNAEYWEKNKDKLALRGRNYAKENLDYFRAKNAERRSKMRVGEPHTPKDVAEILDMQGGKCGYCRKPISGGYHVDHIIPLKRGGSNDRKNIQCLCQRCNNKKGAKDPIVWAQQIGLLI